MRRWLVRTCFVPFGAALFCGFALPACSSDALEPLEPTYRDPGAFVALEEAGPALTLFRTLATLDTSSGERYLFVSIYRAEPETWEQARELARDPALPIRVDIDLYPESALSAPYEVVWFRTLTDEELARLP